MNPMAIAEQYAVKMKEGKANGQNIGELLMVYAEEMSKKTRQGYVDCKVMIRFCWDGFIA